MSCVYCIQQGDDGPVKIGLTTYPAAARLAELQVGNPDPLKLLGVIRTPKARALEAMLHEQLSAHWIRGEWFRPSEEVFAAFATARSEYGVQLSAVAEAA